MGSTKKKKPELFDARDWAWLRPRSREWNEAWQRLAVATGDFDFAAESERSGERWQYMGTIRKRIGWRHQFRHRDHPSTGDRWVLSVPVSKTWTKPKPKVSAASVPKARRAPSPGG